MTTSAYTPNQLTLAANMVTNATVFKFANTNLQSAITAYQANYLTPLREALEEVLVIIPTWIREDTLTSMRLLSGTTDNGRWLTGSPGLGFANYPVLLYGKAPLFVDFAKQLAGYYYGLGPYPQQPVSGSSFAQIFSVVSGFIQSTNQVVFANQNANTYLGPTFTTIDALTTANISNVNPVFDRFAYDLARQGNLVDTTKLDLYGTPAALIQQISAQGKIQGAAPPALQNAMLSAGVTALEIADLVNDNRYSLFNQDGLLPNDFDRIQKSAYQALTTVTGADLTDILEILNVTTPNITNLAQLLDPVKMFPLSYDTLLTPSLDGNKFIFDPAGNVNSSISPIVDSFLPNLSGCDELGKIIPQASATANKAIQVSLQNIPGIANTTWPELAQAIANTVDNPWTPTQEYLPNTVVSVDTATVPNFYQSQQAVPAGIDIGNTAYWKPVDLENMQTMTGLPSIEAQTTPVSPNVNTLIENNVATGTGDYDSITYFDFMGLTVNDTVVATNLATVNSAIATVVTAAGANITNLTTLFTRMKNVVTGVYGSPVIGPVTIPAGLGAGIYNQVGPYTAGDQALGALIVLVPAEIDAIEAAYPVEAAAATTAWNNVVTKINSYQALVYRAGLTPNDIVDSEPSVYNFVQAITEYARDKTAGGAYQYLESIADTASQGGQALIACLREASNQQLLDAAAISGRNQTQIPGEGTVGNDFVDPLVATGLLDNYPASRSQINAS